jgi:hypothetical protein
MPSDELVSTSGTPRDKKNPLLEAIALILVGILVLVIYGSTGYLIYSYWSSIISTIASTYGRIALLILAMVAAFALYIFRVAQRLHYGLTEIMFGVVSVFASIMNAVNIQTSTLQAGAGIYIIVRGLDNFKIGLDENPSHGLWRVWNLAYESEFADEIRAMVGGRRLVERQQPGGGRVSEPDGAAEQSATAPPDGDLKRSALPSEAPAAPSDARARPSG